MALLSPYDPEWPARFEAEAARLGAGFGDVALRIEHVGSTSVPDLCAKPIIDIQISVASLAPLDPLVQRLRELGYAHLSLPEPGDDAYPFFHRPASWPTTHHVHACVAGEEQERKHLVFRDWLRSHPEDRDHYAALKRELADETDEADPVAVYRYTMGKGDWIAQTIERALQSAPREI